MGALMSDRPSAELSRHNFLALFGTVSVVDVPPVLVPSIRTKAVSRVYFSRKLRGEALESQGFGDRSSLRVIVESSRWRILHQPSIRPFTSAMILLFGHPASAGCESAYSIRRSGLADHGTNQATLDAKTSGYGLWVRNIQKSRTASLRAAATLATARGFWWQRC